MTLGLFILMLLFSIIFPLILVTGKIILPNNKG